MSNRTALGGYDVQSGSHNEPGARLVSNVIQLARRPLLRLVARLHGPECKKVPCINSASMQTGNNLSPGLFASVVAMVLRRRKTSHLFTSRAALKLAQFAQTMIDVSVGLLIALFIL